MAVIFGFLFDFRESGSASRWWSFPLENRFLLFLLGVILVFVFPFSSRAESRDNVNAQWALEVELKQLISAHTSFEFGMPLDPKYSPLSRLEFPIDSYWGGVGISRRTARWSFNLKGFRNLSDESRGMIQDSDWEDSGSPWIKTTYSESECRMESSYQIEADVDLQVGKWLGLPSWFALAPLIGVRYQEFNLVSHDGVQWDLTGVTSPVVLAGDSIAFEQTYWQYFLGFRTILDLGPAMGLDSLQLSVQGDWAYVEAHNQDHHLLRGERYTYEDTRGHAWHAALGLKAGLSPNWVLGLNGEYLAIRTTGSHRLVDPLFGIDLTWDNGVKVWSDQVSIALRLEYLF